MKLGTVGSVAVIAVSSLILGAFFVKKFSSRIETRSIYLVVINLKKKEFISLEKFRLI